MDAWTKAKITSEQKNFLLLSALYKIMFTHMCVCVHTHTYTHMGGLGPEPREQQRGQTPDQMRAGGGSESWAVAHTALSRGGGLGPGLRRSE